MSRMTSTESSAYIIITMQTIVRKAFHITFLNFRNARDNSLHSSYEKEKVKKISSLVQSANQDLNPGELTK